MGFVPFCCCRSGSSTRPERACRARLCALMRTYPLTLPLQLQRMRDLMMLLLLCDALPSRATYDELYPTSTLRDPEINSSPEFGRSVSAAGPYFVVGDPVQASGAGCAYVYKHAAGLSVMVIALISANASAGDKCGSRVSIAEDVELGGWVVAVSLRVHLSAPI